MFYSLGTRFSLAGSGARCDVTRPSESQITGGESLSSSCCDKDMEASAANSVASQSSLLSSRASDVDGLWAPLESTPERTKRSDKKKKRHSSIVSSNTQAIDIFSLIACGEVKDNKALKDLIRRQEMEQTTHSSHRKKRNEYSDETKKEKEKEKTNIGIGIRRETEIGIEIKKKRGKERG